MAEAELSTFVQNLIRLEWGEKKKKKEMGKTKIVVENKSLGMDYFSAWLGFQGGKKWVWGGG